MRLSPSAAASVYAARPYPDALAQGSRDKGLARNEPPPPNALGGLRGVGNQRRKGEVE